MPMLEKTHTRTSTHKTTHRFLGAEGVQRDEGADDIVPLVSLPVQLFHKEGEQLVRHALEFEEKHDMHMGRATPKTKGKGQG